MFCFDAKIVNLSLDILVPILNIYNTKENMQCPYYYIRYLGPRYTWIPFVVCTYLLQGNEHEVWTGHLCLQFCGLNEYNIGTKNFKIMHSLLPFCNITLKKLYKSILSVMALLTKEVDSYIFAQSSISKRYHSNIDFFWHIAKGPNNKKAAYTKM